MRSTARLPNGVSAESLSGHHESVLGNPLIAEAFHRTGVVEIWGRGTNRIIEECERHGIEPPTFEEVSGGLFVTFRAEIAVVPQVAPQVTPQVAAILRAAEHAASRSQLQEAVGLKDREHFRTAHLDSLLEAGWITMTIPDKLRSSRQRYRATAAGSKILREGS